MKNPRSIIRIILLVVVGAVFFLAGALKISDPAAFAGAIDVYRLTPRAVSVIVALYVPWLEIFCALALCSAKFRSGALAILAASSVVFVALHIVALAKGLDTCGCFGPDNWLSEHPAPMLVICVLLAAACAWLLAREVKTGAG